MLVRLGCEMGQGWHYGRPAPAEQLSSVIDLQRPRAISRSGHDGVVYSVNCKEGLPSQRLAQLQAVYDGAPVGLAFLSVITQKRP